MIKSIAHASFLVADLPTSLKFYCGNQVTQSLKTDNQRLSELLTISVDKSVVNIVENR